jgi:hypothetical protein
MRLFHFSEDPGITEFDPRPVRIAADRPPGREWLNAPLVWAIEERRQELYLFPRDCPRIILWAEPHTTPADARRWLGDSGGSIAYIERGWLKRVESATIVRYEFPPEGFTDLKDAGMWVSRDIVRPLAQQVLTDLPRQLRLNQTELRPVDSLLPWKDVWASSVHASGIRLRNAAGWT